MSGSRRPVGLSDHLLGAFLCATYIAILLATAGTLAMSRDESFYVEAAERYAPWFETLYNDPSQAFDKRVIDRHWSYNHEHPALAKSVFALSWIAQQKWQVFEEPSQAFRFGGMLSAGLLLWLVYIFGARAASRRVGLFAALCLATLPRFFYHAHLDCFDTPTTLTVTLTVYCYWRSLGRRGWALWTGLAFGAALATKHNSWILPGVLLIHWLWVVANERHRLAHGEKRRVWLTPLWLPAMASLGPALFLLSWPWLWHDTLPRLAAYAAFHLKHEHYNMVFFGTNYYAPPFPISFPFVLTLFTIPATYTLLMLLGIGLRARALMPLTLAERYWRRAALAADPRATDVLWLGCALAPMVVIALPSTPIFGGTKHWMPAYPFLALFAGYAANNVVGALERWFSERSRGSRDWVVVVVFTVLSAPGVAETAHSHPFGLSHYGMAAGGVAGAADRGMNRQFWGFTTGSVVDYLKTAMPKGGTVFLNDTTHKALQMLHRDGRLPKNIRAARSLSEADYVLVHHEDHMAEVDFQAWQAFDSVQPAHVLTYDGVPIVSIYAHPRNR